MRTVSYRIGDLERATIHIGRVAENDYTRVQIDAGEIYAEYPHAAAALTVQPPAGEAYPAVVTREGDLVIWDVPDSALTEEGMGEIQLTFTDGETVVKSAIGRISVCRSIVGEGEAPDPLEDFLAEAGAALTAIPETIGAALEEAKESGEFDGPEGPAGADGADGFSPVVTVSEISGGHSISVTDAEGTETFNVMDGVNGQDGQPGADGYSPSASVTKSGSTATIVITDKDGTTTAQISDGEGADVIDDTAGSGTTDKTWSADKLSSLNSAISSRAEIKDSSKTGVDLDVSDENGNVVLRMKNGHIMTKEFNSSVVSENKSSSAVADLDVSDINGNVIARLKDGNIETKNFKSNLIRQLTGLKWSVIGDSLTEHNIRATKNYHDYIAEETGITVNNMGHSGCGYAKVGGYGKNFIGIAGEIPSDTDVITVFGSGNDMSSGLSLGNVTDTGTSTLCGCINETLDAIYDNFPLTPLGVITPTPWKNAEPSDGTTGMSQYCEAIVQICTNRGIPCLDLYHSSLLHPDDSDFRNIAYSRDEGDGVHPDENGHKLIAPRIRQFLFSII